MHDCAVYTSHFQQQGTRLTGHVRTTSHHCKQITIWVCNLRVVQVPGIWHNVTDPRHEPAVIRIFTNHPKLQFNENFLLSYPSLAEINGLDLPTLLWHTWQFTAKRTTTTNKASLDNCNYQLFCPQLTRTFTFLYFNLTLTLSCRTTTSRLPNGHLAVRPELEEKKWLVVGMRLLTAPKTETPSLSTGKEIRTKHATRVLASIHKGWHHTWDSDRVQRLKRDPCWRKCPWTLHHVPHLTKILARTLATEGRPADPRLLKR